MIPSENLVIFDYSFTVESRINVHYNDHCMLAYQNLLNGFGDETWIERKMDAHNFHILCTSCKKHVTTRTPHSDMPTF